MKSPQTTALRKSTRFVRVVLAMSLSFLITPFVSAAEMTLDDVLALHAEAISSASYASEGIEYETFTARGIYTGKFDEGEVPFLMQVTKDALKFSIVTEQGDFLYSLITGKKGFQRNPETFQWMKLDKDAAARDLRIVGDGINLATKAFRKGLKLGESPDPAFVVLEKKHPNGDTALLSLDSKTMLLTKVVENRSIGDRTVIFKRTYEDYRRVDGRLIPFVVTESALGGWRKFELEEVTLDLRFPDDLFAVPPELSGKQDTQATR